MNGKPAAHHHLRSPTRRAVAARPQERNQETEVRFYLCDHLGTLNALINQRGDIAWATQLDAWGQVVKEYTPHSLYQPIRLPGQHQDQDTGSAIDITSQSWAGILTRIRLASLAD